MTELPLDHAIARNVQMVRDLARKLLRPSAVVLDLRYARDCRDDVIDGYLFETVPLEEFACIGTEQYR